MRRALLLAAAIGILSTAANGQSEGGQPDWIEQAKIVAQMQGITVGEAVRRKRLQDKVADWDYGGKAYGIHSGNMQWEVGGPKYDHYTPAASLPGMGISVVVQ